MGKVQLGHLRIACSLVLAVMALVANGEVRSLAQADVVYERAADWPTVLAGQKWGTVSGAAVDSKGAVYGFLRDTGIIWRFDHSGKFLGTWGPNLVKLAHTI